MGASTLMSLGLRAMNANQTALQTAGHNIANASVKGYSRQQVELATAKGQYSGGGYFGKGVDVVTVSRSHNQFLTQEASRTSSLASMDSARLDQLRRLETLFQPGEGGLGQAANQLFDAMADLATQPADLATRQVVLGRVSDLAQRYRETGLQLERLQDGVAAELDTQLEEVNGIARAIARANSAIMALRGQGQPANDLLDERDRQVARLSELVTVTTVKGDEGGLGVFVGGGQCLVLGAKASALTRVQDTSDPSRSAVALIEGPETRPLTGADLGGGSVTGLLRFQNEDLVQGRNVVGRLARGIADALNAQQQRGVSLQAPLGASASLPMLAVGEPQALPNATNAVDGNGLPIGRVVLTIADSSALFASDYALRESPSSPGSWELTRLADGRVSTVASGDIVDGMQIDVQNAQGGDRFLLQPVGRAAHAMAGLLSDPRDIAAASPLQATPVAGNTGTARIDSLQVTASPLPSPGSTEEFTFTRLVPAVNGYDYDVSSSLSGQTTPWRTGMPLIGANGFSLTITGVPASGDRIVVEPTPAAALATNNGNALSLSGLRDARLLGGGSFGDGWSQALAEVGVAVQMADSAATISGAVAAQSEQFRSAESGVNLDEEAARLIQYQQSYQASAKVLQVAQALMDTLLATAGR